VLLDVFRSVMEIVAKSDSAIRFVSVAGIVLFVTAILIGAGSPDADADNTSDVFDGIEDDDWFRELVETAAAMVILASEGRIRHGNPAFRALWPITVAGDPIRDLFVEGDRNRLDQACLAALRDQLWRGELIMRLPDGAELPVEATLAALKGGSGTPDRHVLICRDPRVRLQSIQQDFDQLKRTESELAAQKASLELANAELTRQAAQLEAANALLHSLATTDGLTGLKNHRAFQERLVEEFERARRYEAPLSVILLDVDQFKQYNDTYGHQEGDRVLKILADVMCNVARETDYLARYGGEEFVILLPNTGREGALRAAERYRSALEAHAWPLRSVTASLGWPR
jgi:diguanylate cyclase (GGDEF)-like protein/PAS domain S-box-containing protein